MSIQSRNISLRAHFGDDRHATLSLGTLYFALFSGDPAGTGVEPDGTGGYARAAKVNDGTLWGVLDGTSVKAFNGGTAGDIEWPAATGLYSVEELTHWAVLDNSTGGAVWYSGPLTSPIEVTGSGDVPRIPAGAFSITQA